MHPNISLEFLELLIGLTFLVRLTKEKENPEV